MRFKKLCALLLTVVLTLGLCSCSIGKKGKYEKAVEAVRNGRYQEAIESLEALDGYEDSAKYIIYARALQAGDSGDYENAIKALEALNGFEKSAVYITSYTTLAYEAEQARMKSAYNQAIADVKAGNYDAAIAAFETLNDYEGSAKYIAYARALQAGDSGDYETAIKALEALNGFEKSAVYITSYTTLAYEAEQARMKNVYNQAIADVKSGNYDAAIAAFETLNDYEDSGKYIMYARCLKTGDSGDYDTAIKSLTSMGDFKEAAMYIKYYTALAHEAAQEYEAAGEVYEEILLFKDAQARAAVLPDKILDRELAEADRLIGELKNSGVEQLKELVNQKYTTSDTQMYENIMVRAGKWSEKQNYGAAAALYLVLKEAGYEPAVVPFGEAMTAYVQERMAEGRYGDAEWLIEEYLSDYEEANSLKNECDYQITLERQAWGSEWAQYAYDAFKALGDYKDSAERAAAYENQYAEAVSKREAGEFDAAIALFTELGSYSDSSAQVQETENAKAYTAAVLLMASEKYEEAITAFNALNGYSDSTAKIDECNTAILEREYQKALKLMTDEKYEDAIQAFEALNGYSDSATKISECNTAILEREYQKALKLMNEEKYEDAIKAFESLNGYSDSTTKISECNTAILEREYQKALKLMNEEKYEDAIKAFESLNGYSDSTTKISECNTAILEREYQTALKLMASEKYEEAIAAFKELNGYRDSDAQITECSYLKAEELRENGQYLEACRIYWTINGYRDVNEIIEKDGNIASAVIQLKFAVGNYVIFGNYPQTNDGNDNSPIEWLVLESDRETALLISRYALDCKPYNTEFVDTTWEQCTLRGWLNNAFYNRAFSTEEKQYILQSDVSADKNPEYSTNPGNATKDNVFLLSIVEANKYFKSDDARKCAPTDYAIQQGAYASDSYKVEGRRACCGGSVRPATIVTSLHSSSPTAPSTTAVSTSVAVLCARACGFGFSKMNPVIL